MRFMGSVKAILSNLQRRIEQTRQTAAAKTKGRSKGRVLGIGEISQDNNCEYSPARRSRQGQGQLEIITFVPLPKFLVSVPLRHELASHHEAQLCH
jgi:DNA invertase Pin-like site-specific DNA recombinase